MPLHAHIHRRLLLAAVLISGIVSGASLSSKSVLAQTPAERAERVAFFESKIRPVLVERCYECHSTKSESVEGGLLLDNRASVLRGGDNGPALKPKDPANSLLIKALLYEGDLQMPPDEKLPDEVIRDFQQWVADGAVDPRAGKALTAAGKIAADAESHWAYQVVEAPPSSPIEEPWKSWSRDEVDRLVAAKLQRAGIQPSAESPKSVWLRRVTYDLTGLPPTFEDAEAFRQDDSGEAYAKVVDRLLSAPQFGERWARHWLDVARYGDTKGYVFTKSRDYPNAFKYRDWVIESLNEDLPYDRFLRLQLAADLVAKDNAKDAFVALGYITLGRRFLNNKHDIIDDRMDVVFRGMMGLTLSCARCHDHKYDPLSAKDYYAVYGIFASSKEQQDEGLPLRLVEGSPKNVRVFMRGKPSNQGEVAPRRFPEFFELGEERFRQGSGRRELAAAVASRDNPLTARVFVNRVWGNLFGEHLVSTPSDFGLRAERPVQQDVLDRLAFDFMNDDWSIKRLIRRLVLSSTYRQSSDWRADADRTDPENRLWWRTLRRRLDFEAMRDSILDVSHRLDRNVGGPSAKIATDPEATRRSLYAFIDRQNLPDLFRTFDFALPDTHSPKRPYTTSPQQSLYLMNSRFAQLSAESLAERLRRAGDDPKSQVAAAYRILYARDPAGFELEAGTRFLRTANPEPSWSLGYGQWSDTEKQLTVTPFPHFNGKTWQGGPKLPDPKLGYASLHATGGHPGKPGMAVMRQWRSAGSGSVFWQGVLKHPNGNGNGVRGRLIRNGSEAVGAWQAKAADVDTTSKKIKVEKGDTLTLIVDCLGDTSFDSFQWPGAFRFRAEGAQTDVVYDIQSSIQPTDLDPLARYAQALLMTNEFHFLD